jgi:DNA-binding response OmpR family regulator
MKQLILVVDSDVACRDALRVCLQSGGLDVAVLYEPGKALARIEVERPALIVTTNGPGYGGGLAVLQALRSRGDDLPIIMLGDQDDVTERIVALECGADDFISKPFNVREVLVRVRRVLERANLVALHAPVSRPPFSFDGFELDYALRRLTFRGKAVPLQQMEYAILNLFTTAPGRLFSKQTIAQRVRPDTPNGPAAVGVWVHRLRKRIERDTTAPKLIQTVRAKGYVFHPGVEERSLHTSRIQETPLWSTAKRSEGQSSGDLRARSDAVGA